MHGALSISPHSSFLKVFGDCQAPCFESSLSRQALRMLRMTRTRHRHSMRSTSTPRSGYSEGLQSPGAHGMLSLSTPTNYVHSTPRSLLLLRLYLYMRRRYHNTFSGFPHHNLPHLHLRFYETKHYPLQV